MEPQETPIENAAGQTAAAVTETATAVADTAADTVANAAVKTETAVAAGADTAAEAAATETTATTAEPAPADNDAPPMNANLVWTIAGGIVVVLLLLKLICRKKGKCATAKPNGKNGGNGGGNGDMVEIYVGNLSYDMNDDQLRREFERFGVVKSARVITNRSNNKSKGYGFVEMPHRKEALIAIKALDNSEVMARRIRVNEARANTKPPEDR